MYLRKFLISCLSLIAIFIFSTPALAACNIVCEPTQICVDNKCIDTVRIDNPTIETTKAGGADIVFNNPMGNNKPETNQILGKIINGVLGVVGSLALVLFVYGGFVYMTALGAPDKIKKGRDIIFWAIIGLVVVFSAYALVNFVLVELIG